MARIIIEVPDSVGPIDLDARILQHCKDGDVIPIFIRDAVPGDLITLRCDSINDFKDVPKS